MHVWYTVADILQHSPEAVKVKGQSKTSTRTKQNKYKLELYRYSIAALYCRAVYDLMTFTLVHYNNYQNSTLIIELMNPSDYEVLSFIFTQLCVKHLIIIYIILYYIYNMGSRVDSSSHICMLKKE